MSKKGLSQALLLSMINKALIKCQGTKVIMFCIYAKLIV